MAVALEFTAALVPRSGRADLAFGAEEGGSALPIAIAARLPPLVAHIVVGRLFQARIAASLAPPSGNLALHYDIAVWNGVAAQSCATANDAGRAHAAGSSAFRHGDRLRIPQCQGTMDASRVDAAVQSGGEPAPARHLKHCATFDDAAQLEQATTGANELLARAHRKHCAGFDDAAQVDAVTLAAQHILYRRAVRLCAGFGDGAPSRRGICGDFAFGLPLAHGVCGCFQRGLPAPWGRATVIPEPPEPGTCYTPPVGFVALAFADVSPGQANLAFICLGRTEPEPPPLVIVPVRRVYLVHNNASLVRLPGLEDIACHTLRIGTDADSWGWSFSADIAATALDAVAPVNGDPVEVQATVNGIAWHFLVEKLQRRRTFGKSTLTISGRSRTAWLAAPYAAPVNHASSDPISAQQIVNAALPPGWSLDWGIDDWLIPGGLWAAYATPLEVAQKVNGAVGAILQSHRTDPALAIGHRYPVAPWELERAVPALRIPEAVTLTEGIEWVDKPAWNAVYVSGQTQGVIGRVKRAGSAGDRVAPLVTDSLITEAAAARQRGMAILGDAGRQAWVTLDLPLIPAEGLGLIIPGTVLEIAGNSGSWRGYARGVNVSAELPAVRQAVEIERPIA